MVVRFRQPSSGSPFFLGWGDSFFLGVRSNPCLPPFRNSSLGCPAPFSARDY